MAAGRGRKATLASVAAQANVSKITASRAFSQPEKVHPETLQRIRDTAEQLGYVVNAAARNLRAKASKTIGIVNPDMANPFFGGLTRLMTLEAQKMGYDTLVFDSYESQEAEDRIIDKLIGYNVDAIILSVISNDVNYHPAYMKRLEILNIPVVLVDRELQASHCSGVYIDNLDCGLQTGRWLLEHQAKRVVVVSGPENSNVARERVTGLQAALLGKVESFEVLHADFLWMLPGVKPAAGLAATRPRIILSAVITRFRWVSLKPVSNISSGLWSRSISSVLTRSPTLRFTVSISPALPMICRR